MKEWFSLREHLYTLRKESQLAKLKREFEVLNNKVRFVKAVILDEVKIKQMKRQEIVNQLQAMKYLTITQLNLI